MHPFRRLIVASVLIAGLVAVSAAPGQAATFRPTPPVHPVTIAPASSPVDCGIHYTYWANVITCFQIVGSGTFIDHFQISMKDLGPSNPLAYVVELSGPPGFGSIEFVSSSNYIGQWAIWPLYEYRAEPAGLYCASFFIYGIWYHVNTVCFWVHR